MDIPHLSSVKLVVDLRTVTKKTCVKKRQDYVPKLDVTK